MSHYTIYKAVKSHFSKITKTYLLIKFSTIRYPDHLREWLFSPEQKLRVFSFSERVEFASVNGPLFANKIENNRSTKKTKENLNAVIELIKPAESTLMNVNSPVELEIIQAKTIIKEVLEEQLEMNKFSWNKGLNYRDFILAVWRTLLRQENTQEKAYKVKIMVGEEGALKLISEQIKIEI